MRKLLAGVVLSLFMVSCFGGYSSGGRSGYSGGSRGYSSSSYSRSYSGAGRSGYSSGYGSRPSYNSSRSYSSSYSRYPSSRSNTTIVNNHSGGYGAGIGGGGFFSGMLGGFMGASMAQHPVMMGGGMVGQPMVGGGMMMDGGVAPVVAPGIGYYSGYSPIAWLVMFIIMGFLVVLFIRFLLCEHDHY